MLATSLLPEPEAAPNTDVAAPIEITAAAQPSIATPAISSTWNTSSFRPVDHRRHAHRGQAEGVGELRHRRAEPTRSVSSSR